MEQKKISGKTLYNIRDIKARGHRSGDKYIPAGSAFKIKKDKESGTLFISGKKVGDYQYRLNLGEFIPNGFVESLEEANEIIAVLSKLSTGDSVVTIKPISLNVKVKAPYSSNPLDTYRPTSTISLDVPVGTVFQHVGAGISARVQDHRINLRDLGNWHGYFKKA